MKATEPLPKICGADIEVGNYIVDASGRSEYTPGFAASRALLREIQGRSAGSYSFAGGYSSQDHGRLYLSTNGGCVYIDLNHLELCLPEVRSAFDHLAAWHAMLRIAREALDAANERLIPGQVIKVLINNSDGHGNSYGSHLNFLVTRRSWENLVHRKPHHLLWLASYLASAIVFSGAGKVGSENDRQPVDFQISQRADFLETVCGPQTTYDRPIVNARDESLAGRGDLARLHSIFFDSTLCHVASLLKVGVTQVILAMLEQEVVDPELCLDDPLGAVLAWSHDPELTTEVQLISGGWRTVVEHQWEFFERACRFVATGRADGLVPRASEILALWEETLTGLASDLESMASHVDWVLKRSILRRALDRHGLSWGSSEAKELDLTYSSLDRSEGLYWNFEAEGLTKKLVQDAEIERFVHEPPTDTRAWTRAQLLRRATAEEIQGVDWDEMSFSSAEQTYWSTARKLRLEDPRGFTKSECASCFERETLSEVLDAIEATRAKPVQGGTS